MQNAATRWWQTPPTDSIQRLYRIKLHVSIAQSVTLTWKYTQSRCRETIQMLKYCSHHIWQWATNSAKEKDCKHLWERSSIVIQHIRIAFQISVHQKSLFYHPLVHSGFTLQDCAHLYHLCVYFISTYSMCAHVCESISLSGLRALSWIMRYSITSN